MKFDAEICKGVSCLECSFNKGEDGCLLAKRLDEIEITPEPPWIPCSERLPSKADHTNDMVLVCYRNSSVRFNTYMNGWVQGNPVAWMPLPEPYKEDDHETD